MRIHIFSNHYFPENNPRAFRTDQIIRSLLEEHEVTYYNSRAVLSDFQETNGSESRKFKIQSKLKRNIYKLFKAWIFPDKSILTAFSVFIKYSLLKRVTKPDMIITISHPWSFHLIGILIKRIYAVQWICDIGDLYAHNPHTPTAHSYLRSNTFKFESYVLRKADFLILNSGGILNYYNEVRGIPKDKMKLIYNARQLEFPLKKAKHHGQITFLFLGSTFNDLRNGIKECSILLETLKSPELAELDCKILLVGNQCDGLIQFCQAEKRVSIVEPISSSEVREFYSKADFLINFSHGTYPGLPSKVPEYFASGIPIVNFCEDMNETSVKFLIEMHADAIHVNVRKLNYKDLIDFILNNNGYDGQSRPTWTDWRKEQKNNLLKCIDRLQNKKPE